MRVDLRSNAVVNQSALDLRFGADVKSTEKNEGELHKASAQFKSKYTPQIGFNSVQRSPAALIIKLEEVILKESTEAIEKQEKRLKQIDKQNKETNDNIEHINRELDKLGKNVD